MSYLKRSDNMAAWKQNKRQKLSRGSHTPGHTKGENCHADGRARIFCSRSRAYKMNGYEEFFTRWDGIKK